MQSSSLPDGKDLLRDLSDEQQYEVATREQRFINFLIDYAVYVVALGIVAYIFGATFMSDSLGTQLLLQLLFLAMYVGYYYFMETFMDGRTLGKMVTGTRAVLKNGNRMPSGKILLRSLARAVPFEPFSAFGTSPWHDEWTGTVVIKSKY
ncbi:RDD family protein [Chitinophaga solisilvae]|uniref:RDD domain-containing protein n=1 Tax=Chitinophaga solisilvae TaxID=1233460 RepID=A0A433WGG5_9BACT|nr:RDD family protein [Chitinophaga solisilvae]NSL90312.1 hypothetical protein [Chitinophaga solisilvae]